MVGLKFLLFFVLLSFVHTSSFSQTLVVEKITFDGLKRTKPVTLYRDLNIAVGDSLVLKDLDKTLELTRQIIFNTHLFFFTNYSYSITNDSLIEINFVVKERWFFFPVPHIALGDRNFNEWWYLRNRSPKRLIYGINFTQKNLTGRNDKLNLMTYFGFEKNFKLQYELPYLNPKNRWGLSMAIGYQDNKVVAFGARENQLSYLRDDEILMKKHFLKIGTTHKPNAFFMQRIESTYEYIQLNDKVLTLNDRFLSNNANHLLGLSYQLNYDRRDIKGYAWKGNLWDFKLSFTSDWISNTFNFGKATARWVHHYKLSEKFSIAQFEQISLSTRGFQPYSVQRGLGWDNNLLRSYASYVVDGQNTWLQKHEFRFKMLTETFTYLLKPIRKTVWYTGMFVPKIFIDMGYVADNQYQQFGSLANQFLLGYGVGADLVSYSDHVFRLEYGKSLHYKSSFLISFTTAIK